MYIKEYNGNGIHELKKEEARIRKYTILSLRFSEDAGQTIEQRFL